LKERNRAAEAWKKTNTHRDSVLHTSLHIRDDAPVALQHNRLHPVILLQFLRELLGGPFAVDIIDGDVTSLGRKFAGDFGA
jgi:hypothetical protein